MKPTKLFYGVENAAAFLGLSTRHLTEVSATAGVTPHNFSGPRVRDRFMWTHDQLETIKKYRETAPKKKAQRRARFR
jgi:hypothetical protein